VAVSFGTMTGGKMINETGTPTITHTTTASTYYAQRLTTGP
jgi:hypothetical protein